MIYRKISTGEYPFTEDDIKALSPDTSFGDTFDIESFGYEPVYLTSQPSFNAFTQQVEEISPVKVNGQWQQNWQVIDKPFTAGDLNQLKESIKTAITEYRYNKEIGGLEVNGIFIKTDPASQAKINAAFTSLKEGFVTSIDWKGNNGWVTLTLPEVTFIATAVANHVRDCFTKEKELLERINILDTLQELQMFNVEQEWNS